MAKTAKITSGSKRETSGSSGFISQLVSCATVAAVGFARTIMKKPGALPGLATYFQQLILPNTDLVTRSIAIPNNRDS